MNQLPEDLSKADENSGDPIDAGSVESLLNVESHNINLTPLYPNMEVHHHPDLHHNRKKWKEYFLEFLMIFLAVSLGFIAENVREHFTEDRNARILAKSMLEDLRKDTTVLHSCIQFSERKMNSIEVILSTLHSPRALWNDTIFYKNFSPLLTSFPFNSTDGTYDQMKTSGTLRYFNQSIVNLMNSYAVQYKKTSYRDEGDDKGAWILAPFIFDVINIEVLYDIRFNRPITHETYIKKLDKTMVDKLINLIVMTKSFRTRTLMEYNEQLKIANKLITVLRKEYELE